MSSEYNNSINSRILTSSPLTATDSRNPWELQIPIEDTGISSGVSAIEFKGKLYVFYIKAGGHYPYTIGYALLAINAEHTLVLESLNELPTKEVAQLRPCVTVYNDHLFCFFTATDQTLRYRVFTGTEWSPVDIVPQTLSADAPSVVTHGEKIYLALQGTPQGVLYHKVFENYSWGPNIPQHNIRFNGSPSLCIYADTPHMAISGLDEHLYLLAFEENQWGLVSRSDQGNIYGAPSLHAWAKFIISATHIKDSNRYSTELMHQQTHTHDIYSTLGAYRSPPCLTTYLHELYLIGQRSCGDLGISLFNPI